MTAFCSTFYPRPQGIFVSRVAVCEIQRSAFVQRRICRSAPPSHTRARVVVMQAKEEGTGVGLRIFSGVLVAGLIATSLGPVFSGIGTALRGGETKSTAIVDKLHKVPLFAVTDETGRPFLAEAANGRSRVGYFFVTPSDAEEFLERVRESAPAAEAPLARVRSVGLDEALPFLNRKSRVGSGIPETFEIVPDAGEVGLARVMTGGNFEKVFAKGVPLFFVDSLALQGAPGDDPVIPLFFEKEKLDEFVQKANDNGSGNVIKPEDVQVIDLMQTIREMKEGANERLKQVVLFPMEKAMLYQYFPDTPAASDAQ